MKVWQSELSKTPIIWFSTKSLLEKHESISSLKSGLVLEGSTTSQTCSRTFSLQSKLIVSMIKTTAMMSWYRSAHQRRWLVSKSWRNRNSDEDLICFRIVAKLLLAAVLPSLQLSDADVCLAPSTCLTRLPTSPLIACIFSFLSIIPSREQCTIIQVHLGIYLISGKESI